MKDLKGELEGTRTPMRGLFEDAKQTFYWARVEQSLEGAVMECEEAKRQVEETGRGV